MTVVKDTEYNATYPARPERFIITDDGGPGPTYFTEDVIVPSKVKAAADVVKWDEVAIQVTALQQE